MKKMIIYRNGSVYTVTTVENYEAQISNARQFKNFPVSQWEVDEIIQYYAEYGWANKNDWEVRV